MMTLSLRHDGKSIQTAARCKIKGLNLTTYGNGVTKKHGATRVFKGEVNEYLP
jgi:hypothetical protein